MLTITNNHQEGLKKKKMNKMLADIREPRTPLTSVDELFQK